MNFKRQGLTDNQLLNFIYKYINNFASLSPYEEISKSFTEIFIDKVQDIDTISEELYNEMKLFCYNERKGNFFLNKKNAPKNI